MIHAFNQRGLALDPLRAEGRPRLISDDDADFIVATALARPVKLGLPFTHRSLRKLAAWLSGDSPRHVLGQAGEAQLWGVVRRSPSGRPSPAATASS